jgi:hypothetical protein
MKKTIGERQRPSPERELFHLHIRRAVQKPSLRTVKWEREMRISLIGPSEIVREIGGVDLLMKIFLIAS